MRLLRPYTVQPLSPQGSATTTRCRPPAVDVVGKGGSLVEPYPRRLRICLGHFATGVTVVSCDADDGPHGATVNAFMAVSLNPPLVQVSLDRRSTACAYLAERPFVVNVLAGDQHMLALHFAGQPQAVAVGWRGDYAIPALEGCIAYVSCLPWRTYDGGDHLLVLGEVQHCEFHAGSPLIFYRGKFRDMGPAFEGTPWIESLDCPSSQSRIAALG